MNFNLVAKANEIIAKEGNFDVIHAHDWLVAYAAKNSKKFIWYTNSSNYTCYRKLVEIQEYTMKHKDI